MVGGRDAYGSRPRSCSNAADDLPISFWKNDAIDREKVGLGPPRSPDCSATNFAKGPFDSTYTSQSIFCCTKFCSNHQPQELFFISHSFLTVLNQSLCVFSVDLTHKQANLFKSYCQHIPTISILLLIHFAEGF